MRFPISFEPSFRLLCKLLFLSPDGAHLDVAGDLVMARFAWSFRATFPRGSVASIKPFEQHPISRGVHGFAGRWLVNGSGDGLVEINLEPAARGYVIGFPVKLKQLLVSVEDPAGLIAALAPEAG